MVFYDYDELALLETCNFREIPQSDRYEDEMLAEPWFPVGPDDVFPEEFGKFFRIPKVAKQDFDAVHGDLSSVHFWRGMQAQHASHRVPEFFPYPEDIRLHRPVTTERVL